MQGTERFEVVPSGIVISAEDGQTLLFLDIGYLYAMMAASMKQNGIWADIDFDSLPEDWRSRFTFNMDYIKPGEITGMRFTRKRAHGRSR